MARNYQVSLFGGGPGKGHLFDQKLLNQYLREHAETPIQDFDGRVRRVNDWIQGLAGSKANESGLEAGFLSQILCGALGYRSIPVPAGEIATAHPKPPSSITGISRTPDVALGEFGHEGHQIRAVVELKTPGTSLDLPQAGYKNESPVDQALDYGTRILGVRWVLVSDLRVIRLYSVDSAEEYEEFDLRECKSPEAFRRLHFLFGWEALIHQDEGSQVSALYSKSAGHQLEITEGFYQAYYEIRATLFDAIREASKNLKPTPERPELLQATQRLLDRLLFLYYCEDHPQQLIPSNTVAEVTANARKRLGRGASKVYQELRELFREIDTGSPPDSGIQVAGYNGELFKDHRIIDHIDLPDTLHERNFLATDGNKTRVIRGVWGLHEYDFWSELNEHLLGHVFEESLSDLQQLGVNAEVSLDEKLRQRKKSGIFFTTSILSDFLSNSALKAVLDERAPLASNGDIKPSLTIRLNCLTGLRAADLACGSGAFLVSTYRAALHEFWKLRTTLEGLTAVKSGGRDLFEHKESVDQASLLRDCLSGADLMPQAVEIAKLALWLRSAKKGEKVPDLSENLVAANSLDAESLFDQIHAGPGHFDLVIGNPPWGGEVPPDIKARATEFLGLSPTEPWDSWELFLVLGLHGLKEGGRLALVLPDSLLYPEKARVRRILFEMAQVEKLHNVGPDWFGKHVRMGTVLLQARRGPTAADAKILCATATGELRVKAIKGKVPLTQIETQRGRFVPVARVLKTAAFEVEVFRGDRDDKIIQLMEDSSGRLEDMCERSRGEEMGKSGAVWECPGCLSPTTPGKKKKGGGLEDKKCPSCGHLLTEKNVKRSQIVETLKPDGSAVPFIDGDDLCRRYQTIQPRKWLRLGLNGWDYKPGRIYSGTKILVRQAGIGLVATMDTTGARCPQSVYVYRLNAEARSEGYKHEYLLAVLLSRTMTYFVFKRFGETDPAKAHAKLTHERLAGLPIPRVNFEIAAEKKLHERIVERVRRLLARESELGEQDDREIEADLRQLWGISPSDGAYINGEFYDVPDSQARRDLFPSGPPRPEVPMIPPAESAGE